MSKFKKGDRVKRNPDYKGFKGQSARVMSMEGTVEFVFYTYECEVKWDNSPGYKTYKDDQLMLANEPMFVDAPVEHIEQTKFKQGDTEPLNTLLAETLRKGYKKGIWIKDITVTKGSIVLIKSDDFVVDKHTGDVMVRCCFNKKDIDDVKYGFNMIIYDVSSKKWAPIVPNEEAYEPGAAPTIELAKEKGFIRGAQMIDKISPSKIVILGNITFSSITDNIVCDACHISDNIDNPAGSFQGIIYDAKTKQWAELVKEAPKAQTFEENRWYNCSCITEAQGKIAQYVGIDREEENGVVFHKVKLIDGHHHRVPTYTLSGIEFSVGMWVVWTNSFNSTIIRKIRGISSEGHLQLDKVGGTIRTLNVRPALPSEIPREAKVEQPYTEGELGWYIEKIEDKKIREEVFENIKNQFSNNPDIFYSKKHTYSVAEVVNMFIWAKTPQGHTYWAKIMNSFLKKDKEVDKTTAEYWIGQVKDCELAIKIEHNRKHHLFAGYGKHKIREFATLINQFNWKSTPEGHAFWARIHSELSTGKQPTYKEFSYLITNQTNTNSKTNDYGKHKQEHSSSNNDISEICRPVVSITTSERHTGNIISGTKVSPVITIGHLSKPSGSSW